MENSTYNKIMRWGMYILFFLPLFGIAYPAYVFILLALVTSLKNRNATTSGILLTVSFAFIVFVKYNQVMVIPKMTLLTLYFFGYILIYAFLYYTRARINIDKLIQGFIIAAFVELILNIFFPQLGLLHNDKFEVDAGDISAVGKTFRVYSVGCNATVSSTLMCMLLFYREMLVRNGLLLRNFKLELWAFFSMILFASGTGFSLYLIYILYRFKLLTFKTVGLGVVAYYVVLVICTHFFNNSESSGFFYKFTFDSMEGLSEYKVSQIKDTIVILKQNSFWIGSAFRFDVLQLSHDFALLDLWYSWGYIGVLILFLFTFRVINKYNAPVLLIGLTGLIHYGSIFSLPGQLIFAYAMLLNKDTLAYYADKTDVMS
jgi:hypothetical protein